MSERIVFQVQTDRLLRILTSEIYDSPLALLRENVQNAYDAVRMKYARSGTLETGGRIDIQVGNGEIKVTDNGIGMDEMTLRNNFWRTGSSGKHSDGARRAGVIGTFGIGAMANFGVCTQLTVETQTEGETEMLRSVARLDSLKIAEECITLERIASDRVSGTTVTAILDSQHTISQEQATQYLDPYVALLPVPVYINQNLVSGATVESRLPITDRTFTQLGAMRLNDDLCGGTFDVSTDSNGQILIVVTDITLGGNSVDGSMTLMQSSGQLMGCRSYFGLAPIPAIGFYQLGGYANLSFLHPTAGREALSRESIDHVTRLLNLAEKAASETIASTTAADTNNAFLYWIISHGRYDLAGKVSVQILPENKKVDLEDVRTYIGSRRAHYYTGTDKDILRIFANEDSHLLHLVQVNPRQNIQLYYLQNKLGISAVPDAAQVTHVYKGAELTVQEASVLVRTGSILRDDYLIPDVEIVLADISHGVTVLPEKVGEQLKLYIARSGTLLPPLLGFYDTAYSVFGQFMKDFVRVHIYPRIQQFVPSSTRDGVDVLRQLLQRNREVYHYEETDLGDLEGILGEYLSGNVGFNEIMMRARSAAGGQSQSVSPDQVGSIENVVPDVVGSPIVQATEEGIEFAPCPPIIREEVLSDMKILTTDEKYVQLNNFTMLLGLSDRLMRTEAEFFRAPHTTRILWGGHRVIYIFTEATGQLSLYYDIELREPIDKTRASGGMFPTTTLITKKRIFVPVPEALADEFRIATGSKEFIVRFDLLSSDLT